MTNNYKPDMLGCEIVTALSQEGINNNLSNLDETGIFKKYFAMYYVNDAGDVNYSVGDTPSPVYRDIENKEKPGLAFQANYPKIYINYRNRPEGEQKKVLVVFYFSGGIITHFSPMTGKMTSQKFSGNYAIESSLNNEAFAGELKGNLKNNMNMIKKEYDTDVFSLERLFMDLQQSQTKPATNDEYTDIDDGVKNSIVDFMSAYFDYLYKNNYTTLDYNIKSNSPDGKQATFAPTEVDVITNLYFDPKSGDKPIYNPNYDSINYRCMVGSKSLPSGKTNTFTFGNSKFINSSSGNWVDGSALGVMAISKSKFFDNYIKVGFFKKANKFYSLVGHHDNIDTKKSKWEEIDFDSTVDKEMRDQFKLNDPDTKILASVFKISKCDGKKHTSLPTDTQHHKHYEYHLSSFVCYRVNTNVIEMYVRYWFHYNDHKWKGTGPTRKDWRHDYYLTITRKYDIEFTVDSKGQVVVKTSDATPELRNDAKFIADNEDKDDPDPNVKNFNDISNELIKQLPDMADEIENQFATLQKFTFPGNKNLEFSNLFFDDKGNLFAHISKLN